MAIQTQLYPSNAGPVFTSCGYEDLMIDNQSCFNFPHNHQQQLFSILKHNQQVPVELGCLQQQQQQQQLYNNKLRNQTMSLVDPTKVFTNWNAFNINYPSTLNPQGLSDLMFPNQWDDVDHLIKLQNENLRIMVQEQRKQQLAELLRKLEFDALYELSQKDGEIERATRKTTELEEYLTRLEAENELWRKEAQEKEAMVMSLHNTLEQIRVDASSRCDEGRRNMAMEDGTGENRVCSGGVGGDAEQVTRNIMVCNNCRSQSSCVMFLPCRHLCSCKACEAFLQACPVCKMSKKASIEALIS